MKKEQKKPGRVKDKHNEKRNKGKATKNKNGQFRKNCLKKIQEWESDWVNKGVKIKIRLAITSNR